MMGLASFKKLKKVFVLAMKIIPFSLMDIFDWVVIIQIASLPCLQHQLKLGRTLGELFDTQQSI